MKVTCLNINHPRVKMLKEHIHSEATIAWLMDSNPEATNAELIKEYNRLINEKKSKVLKLKSLPNKLTPKPLL